MITIKEWDSLSNTEKSTHLERNFKATKLSLSRGKAVEGLGINDANYLTQPRIDGVRLICPAYRSWTDMLKRVYSAKCHAKQPTYLGVKVCDEWHSFMSFRKWWLWSQVDGFALDKDIASDDGVYSPDTCIFVPAWLNLFTTDCGVSRGEWPIGVYYHRGTSRFRAQCNNPMTKKRDSLGYFHTPEAAHAAWLNRKLELALELKPKMDEIDPRIYQRVCEIISNAK